MNCRSLGAAIQSCAASRFGVFFALRSCGRPPGSLEPTFFIRTIQFVQIFIRSGHPSSTFVSKCYIVDYQLCFALRKCYVIEYGCAVFLNFFSQQASREEWRFECRQVQKFRAVKMLLKRIKSEIIFHYIHLGTKGQLWIFESQCFAHRFRYK